jgi:DNA repair exonuclease SbcCD ATPase subunit
VAELRAKHADSLNGLRELVRQYTDRHKRELASLKERVRLNERAARISRKLWQLNENSITRKKLRVAELRAANLRQENERLEEENKRLTNEQANLGIAREQLKMDTARLKELERVLNIRRSRLDRRENDILPKEVSLSRRLTEAKRAEEEAKRKLDEAKRLEESCTPEGIKLRESLLSDREEAVLNRERNVIGKETALNERGAKLKAYTDSLLAREKAVRELGNIFWEIIERSGRVEKCPQCKGLGGLDSAPEGGCPTCNGTGWIKK